MRVPFVLSVLLVSVLVPAAPFTAGWAQAQSPGGADKSQGGEGEASAPRKPSIGIDSLLRPRSMTPSSGSAPAPAAAPTEELHGGRNREAWAKAFIDARAEVREIETRLEKSRKKVREASSSSGAYQYSPIGGTESTSTDPEVLKARAQAGRDKKELEAAQTRLRDLQVEASLAGVPEEWIPSEPESRPASTPPASEPADTPADRARPN